MAEEREWVPRIYIHCHVITNNLSRHIKSHIKDEYINAESLDDDSLLMQYFRKHDADNNHKLDGLELLKALARMDGKHNNDNSSAQLACLQRMTTIMMGDTLGLGR